MQRYLILLGAILGILIAYASVKAEEIGSVTTEWKFLGANHKIVIEAFDDPDIPGVACHLSRAKTGGISGSVGLAEDTADASIACRQIGPIDTTKVKKRENGEDVFRKSTSILFKKIHVTRFYDKDRNVLIYLAYSDKLIEGSPKNAISSVPIMPWGK